MVRWTQLNALMPALQFSIAPWDLSEETAKLCAEAVALRKKVRQCPKLPFFAGVPPLMHKFFAIAGPNSLLAYLIACR